MKKLHSRAFRPLKVRVEKMSFDAISGEKEYEISRSR